VLMATCFIRMSTGGLELMRLYIRRVKSGLSSVKVVCFKLNLWKRAAVNNHRLNRNRTKNEADPS